MRGRGAGSGGVVLLCYWLNTHNYLSRSSKLPLSIRYPQLNAVCTSPFPHRCHVHGSFPSLWFDHPKNICYGVQSIKVLRGTRHKGGQGSSVGIVSKLRAGRSGIESRWGRDFPPFQTGPGAHPTSCKICTGSFPGVKCGRGVLLITHPLLVPRSWKSRAILLHTLWVTPGLYRDHVTFTQH